MIIYQEKYVNLRRKSILRLNKNDSARGVYKRKI